MATEDCIYTEGEMSLVLKAAQFGIRAHGNVKRAASKVPYITHPVDVSQILLDEGRVYDPFVLAAAILHDTVEDTTVTLEEITKEFNATVAGYVREVSDDRTLQPSERKKRHVKNFAALSRSACDIKLADMISNLRDTLRHPPGSWSLQRIQGYAVWCRAVTLQAANRAGDVNELLEDALLRIFSRGQVAVGGKLHYLIPKDVDLDETLNSYYRLVDNQ